MTLERRLQDVVRWAYSNHLYDTEQEYKNDLAQAEKPDKTTADFLSWGYFVRDCEAAAVEAIKGGDEKAAEIRRVCASVINELSKLIDAEDNKQRQMRIRFDYTMWEAEDRAMSISHWLNVYSAERDRTRDCWGDVATLDALCVELDEISKKIRAFVELRID